MNSNINVYMISYVVPIYVDGKSIGVVGMDINFKSNPASQKLYKHKDEAGHMALSIHEMRKNLRNMISTIKQVQSDIKSTSDQLTEITDKIHTMSNSNNDTTRDI